MSGVYEEVKEISKINKMPFSAQLKIIETVHQSAMNHVSAG